MRQMENENVNRFIGICIDGPQMMSLWRNCSRGSINDVVMKGALMMDNFFVVSLLKDIVNGISFIHHSFLGCHGYITSKCCVVNDRWQVKVSDYGVDKLRIADKRTHRGLFQLYTCMKSPLMFTRRKAFLKHGAGLCRNEFLKGE
ncbi:hypothetical protein ANCCAN_05922 [Ancylostoma caninum]|uniref:guanylate cyclase n=1 Tax=Ancylostoma caninum TaxID=29170 RepID=A0A368GUE1_ANCCA|nr:hypothetical protein ANCCAN_05922 [Ancylostoma caninum]